MAKRRKFHRKPQVTTDKPHISSQGTDLKGILIELGRLGEKIDRLEKSLRIEERTPRKELSGVEGKIEVLERSIEAERKLSRKEMELIEEKLNRLETTLQPGETYSRREPHVGTEKEFVDIDLKIFDVLESHGPMTSKELAQRCGFRDRSSFQKRYLKPMVLRKLLFPIKRGRVVIYRLEKGGNR